MGPYAVQFRVSALSRVGFLPPEGRELLMLSSGWTTGICTCKITTKGRKAPAPKSRRDPPTSFVEKSILILDPI